MGLLDRIFGKKKNKSKEIHSDETVKRPSSQPLPKTVSVQFIDASSNRVFATSEMPLDKLPETFEVQTNMFINDEEWSVEEAIPAHSKDFIQSKKLTLKLRKIEYVDPKNILFSLPTISNELPQRSNESIYKDFEHVTIEDDWRQMEFLKKSVVSKIEVEINEIEKVKQEDRIEVESGFSAYKNCHIRGTIGEPHLEIPLEKLKRILKTEEIGSLKIKNEFVKDGFALKSEFSTFYGIEENGIVNQLCVGGYTENTPKDIDEIVQAFNLVFVGWVTCLVIRYGD